MRRTYGTLRFSTPLPSAEEAPLRQWLSRWRDLYNRLVTELMKDRGQLEEIVDQGDILPQEVYLPMNAYLDQGNVWRKIHPDTQSWALRFRDDGTTSRFEILHSPANANPISWNVRLVFTPGGTPVGGDELPYVGIDNAQAGTPYAKVDDLNSLRVELQGVKDELKAQKLLV